MSMRQAFYRPWEAVLTPRDDHEPLTDHWWVSHPEHGLAFSVGNRPQCNRDQRVAETILRKMSGYYLPGSEVTFVAVAYVPIDGSDQ